MISACCERFNWFKRHCAHTILLRAVFGLALVVLSAFVAWITVDDARVGIHSTSIKTSVAELALGTLFEFEFAWIQHILLVTDHLFIHVEQAT